MCRHMPRMGLLVCFACLALSTQTAGQKKQIDDAETLCHSQDLFDKFSEDGSISLKALEEILRTVREKCSLNWTEKKTEAAVVPCRFRDKPSKQSSQNSEPVEPSSNVPYSLSSNAWLYAGLSVLFISGCGLAAVAVIRILPQWLFQPAIQFLVALAVGTLTGDAVLHLIPHALISDQDRLSLDTQVLANTNSSEVASHDHSHGQDEHESAHGQAVWKGVVILTVLTFFFVIERLLNIFGEWRRRMQSSKQVTHVAQLVNKSSKMVGEKLCRHHQQSHRGHKSHKNRASGGTGHSDEPDELLSEQPNNEQDVVVSCVSTESDVKRPRGGVFLNNQDDAACSSVVTENECARSRSNSGNGCLEWQGLVVGKPLIYCTTHEICDGTDATVQASTQRVPTGADAEHRAVRIKSPSSESEDQSSSPAEGDEDQNQIDSLTVFISEHHTSHHGHSHSHGHIHARPKGVASLAWLVLAGDGMHNLSDGLAIGAAFAANITGGFTTAIAVLCHELPHELGDFAVLLKAGMTIKQAMICNLVSSLLCLIGVIVGLAIGSTHDAAPWIFASTAGMFIYIALVDMVPELNGHMGTSDATILQLFIQLAGLLCGFAIMLTIALYEAEFARLLEQF